MKKQLRNKLRKQRSELPLSIQSEKSSQIVDLVSQSNTFINSRKIAFYHAVRGEANPAGLAQKARLQKLGTQFYLPILEANKSLVFAPVNLTTKFRSNQFSIPEPICDKNEIITADQLDLVIVPLLGFDKHGNRLGMGGGYYDRSFAFKKQEPIPPILMGFAYAMQEIDSLAAESWDVALDMIATENKLRNL